MTTCKFLPLHVASHAVRANAESVFAEISLEELLAFVRSRYRVSKFLHCRDVKPGREQRSSSDTESSSVVPTPEAGASRLISAVDLQTTPKMAQPSQADVQPPLVSIEVFSEAEEL